MNDVSDNIDYKRDSFRKLLHRLAKDLIQDKQSLPEYYHEFEAIYQNDFRHYYSDIARVMYDIAKYERYIESRQIDEDINTLCMNLAYLNDNYSSYKMENENNNIHLCSIDDKLKKLYDHVSLESVRMDYSDLGDRRLAKLSTSVTNLGTQAKEMNENFEKIRKKASLVELKNKKIEEKLDKAQTDYIAILGIFASVVLAFVGGMAFSTSVLENIKDVSIYRLLTVALIIGMVFVTVIFLMFYFIGVLTGRKLTDERSIEPLRLSYVVFICMIVLVFAMWCLGIVESRDSRIKKNFESIETIETEITDPIESEKNTAAAE